MRAMSRDSSSTIRCFASLGASPGRNARPAAVDSLGAGRGFGSRAVVGRPGMESPAINDIQRAIAHFSGYDNEEHRRLADEQVRAFLGERLAELPESATENLSPDDQ